MSHACTPILVGMDSPVSEILLLSKTAKFSFRRGCHRDDVEDEQIVDMLEQAVYDNDMDFMDGGGGGGEEEEMAVAQEQVNTCTCTQLKICSKIHAFPFLALHTNFFILIINFTHAEKYNPKLPRKKRKFLNIIIFSQTSKISYNNYYYDRNYLLLLLPYYCIY